MRPAFRVPLAWLTLMHHKRRLVASVAGLLCAVLLMFVELGFLNALFESQARVLQRLNAELVIISKLRLTFATNLSFPRRRLYQALGVDGVIAAYPLYIEYRASLWKNPVDRSRRPIRVLAFDPAHPVFNHPEIDAHREALKQADTAVMDTKSKRYYGKIRPGTTTELARRSIRIVGLYTLGTDFTSGGNLIMSETNFPRYFPHRRSSEGNLESVEIGLLRLAPDADPAVVQRSLREVLPGDVMVLTKQQLIDRELLFWQEGAAIGYIFGLGAAMGFVIGVMICYQILFTDVTDHLPQYATLKAMGYGNGYLIWVVMQEALLLSLFGFLPGLALSQVFYQWLAMDTGLPMHLTLGRVGLILVFTITMAMLSGLIAVRKAMAADPAEVFG